MILATSWLYALRAITALVIRCVCLIHLCVV